MSAIPTGRVLGRSICLLTALLISACSEPVSNLSLRPVTRIEAALVLSNETPGVGETFDVFTVATTHASTFVGSFTARVTFDSTALHFGGVIPMEGGPLRVSNVNGGVLRFAGASAEGFTDGRLAGWRLKVLDPAGVGTLRLIVEEIHTVARDDARSNLTLAPTRGIIQ